MQLNTYMLQTNIKKATPAAASYAGLVQGIWTPTTQTAVTSALSAANAALTSATTQAQVDSANLALDTALRGLRRTGTYPDPQDLPVLNTLPDPFTFFAGTKVQSLADWTTRRTEIKNLMQYYEFGYMPPAPQSVTAVSTAGTSGTQAYKSVAVTVTDNGKTASFTPVLYLPTTGTPPYPVIVEEDIFASAAFSPPNSAFLQGGYAVLSIPTSDYPQYGFPGVASDDGNHTGTFFNLYPYVLDTAGDDHGVLLAWAWGASRGVDALQYLAAHDPNYAGLLNLNKLVVTGYSRYGKAALLAGVMDTRFMVTAPGGAGSSGPTPYRYDSFGNRPFRSTFGNVYPWGVSTGAEVMGDHVRHQTHNSNEMIRRFLNDIVPAAVEQRMYQTNTWGYGQRLPYDHHEEVSLIAPRAVVIDATNNDYADNAEGDAIGFEASKAVFQFLGAPQNLALDLDLGNTGHGLTPAQAQHIVNFSNFVLNGTALPAAVQTQLTTDPYLAAGTYDTYYGGLSTMEPWVATMPHANLLTSLSTNTGAISPVFAETTTSYTLNVPFGTASVTVGGSSEDPKAMIKVNSQAAVAGSVSQLIALTPGINTVNVAVTAQDGVVNTYQLVVTESGARTTTTVASSALTSYTGASVTFTANVTAATGGAPTGTVTFLDGTATLGTGTLTASGATTSTATFSTSALAAGTHTITAAFGGIASFAPSTSAAISEVINTATLTAAFSPNSLTIASGAMGTTTLTLTPVGNFSGTVTVACTQVPFNLGCAFTPSSFTFTGNGVAQTSTLAIGTQNGIGELRMPGSVSNLAVACLTFPCLGLLALAGRRRARGLKLLGIALLSLSAILAANGCSSGSNGNVTPGSYTVPVSVSGAGAAMTVNLSITVQ